MVRLLLIFAVVLITGCKSTPGDAPKKVTTESVSALFNHRAFMPQNIPSESSLFTLPDSEKQKLHQHFQRMKNKNSSKDEFGH
ncbi:MULTISPECIES: hypothetical protein [unclassified Pseudoalteromonas]|uniref:hypothetical protein n=1 Tax=unclassified Pseudoalteromonas TaxID=194690 RepID=UPI0030149FF3